MNNSSGPPTHSGNSIAGHPLPASHHTSLQNTGYIAMQNMGQSNTDGLEMCTQGIDPGMSLRSHGSVPMQTNPAMVCPCIPPSLFIFTAERIWFPSPSPSSQHPRTTPACLLAWRLCLQRMQSNKSTNSCGRRPRCPGEWYFSLRIYAPCLNSPV